ncbi:MAG: NUDIX domain-containing protein [Candidatus Kerfeldbacteria bacterium]|nr:NUDIX domain-containing protein [Candidatus Kerfeldbacteria bacterium]
MSAATSKYDGQVETVVGVLIVDEDGRILLIQSPKWSDKSLFPGGHVEYGESILEAAKREGEEETGLKLEPNYVVNVGENIHNPSFERPAHFLFIHVVCRALTTQLSLNSELSRFELVVPEEALKRNLEAGARKSIENYQRGVRYGISSHQWPQKSEH